jgi:hypothetical protein
MLLLKEPLPCAVAHTTKQLASIRALCGFIRIGSVSVSRRVTGLNPSSMMSCRSPKLSSRSTAAVFPRACSTWMVVLTRPLPGRIRSYFREAEVSTLISFLRALCQQTIARGWLYCFASPRGLLHGLLLTSFLFQIIMVTLDTRHKLSRDMQISLPPFHTHTLACCFA